MLSILFVTSLLALSSEVALACVCPANIVPPSSFNITTSLLYYNATAPVGGKESMTVDSVASGGATVTIPRVFKKIEIYTPAGGAGYVLKFGGTCTKKPTYPWPFGFHSGKEFLGTASRLTAVWPPTYQAVNATTPCMCEDVPTSVTVCNVGGGANFTGPNDGTSSTVSLVYTPQGPSTMRVSTWVTRSSGSGLPVMFCQVEMDRTSGKIVSGFAALYSAVNIGHFPTPSCSNGGGHDDDE